MTLECSFLAGQRAEANPVDYLQARPSYSRSQLLQNSIGLRPVRAEPFVPCTIGLRPKHPITPSTKPTRCFVGRSGSHCGKKFVTANAFQLLSCTSSTILMVHILFVLSSLPIPPRRGVRKTNLKATMTNPVNKTFCLWPNVGTKTFMQPTGLHVNKQFTAILGRLGLRPPNPDNTVHEPCVSPFQNVWEASSRIYGIQKPVSLPP